MNRYEEQGMHALLPGLQHMLDIMHNEVDYMLKLTQDESGVPFAPKGSMAQDRRSKLSAAASRTWQNMSAKQKRARLDAMKRGRTHPAKD